MMFKYITIPLFLLALLLPTNIVQVSAQEDPIEDDVSSEDVKVESEDTGEETAPTGKDAEEEEQMSEGIRITSDAKTAVLFPEYPDKQLPAGKPISVLVGLHNNGEKDFIVQTIDASFRYPQDYSYHIQNFTGVSYNRVVPPGEEASFRYSFYPHESYGGRPFGLTIIMLFKDSDGNQFGSGVFNETVTFKELDEAFDGETFFLYILLVAIAILIIFGINYAVSNKLKKSGPKQTETGTQDNPNNVDYDWLPKETTEFNKPSPRRSPRQRRTKRSTGSGEE